MLSINRIIITAAVTIAAAVSYAPAFEGNDDNVMRDVIVLQYRSDNYEPDFEKLFRDNAAKQNYKELREYLNRKNEMLRVLRMAGDEYYYGLSYSRQASSDYLQRLTDDAASRKPSERILLRLNSARPQFNFNGEFSVDHIRKEILPVIRARIDETNRRGSVNEVAYAQIQKNVALIERDIFLAEQALNAVLSPETRDQQFRLWVSITFSGLIAVLMLAFFMIIFKRSDSSLSRHLLGGAGLQFITVFILIIAIILFGILKILGGSELAAILSGISGYILGKGNAREAEGGDRDRLTTGESDDDGGGGLHVVKM